MTTAEQKPRRTFQGIIQSIADKAGTSAPYFTITFQPRPGMKYPDYFHGRDMALKEGFKAGDDVVLTLEQGKPKEGKDAPQYEADYWWNVIGIEKAAPPKPEAVAPAQLPGVAGAVRPAGIPGDREAAIARAHGENMAAAEAHLRATAYECATHLAVLRAELAKDPALASMENIKKLANDYWAEFRAK